MDENELRELLMAILGRLNQPSPPSCNPPHTAQETRETFAQSAMRFNEESNASASRRIADYSQQSVTRRAKHA